MRNVANIELALSAGPVARVTLRDPHDRDFPGNVWRWAAGFYGVANFVPYRETLRLLMWMRALNL
ncbi:MAG TPA: hypothetical protein VKS20_03535 [Candidatus Acidoferrales bacterium]|nr:hypothetical protein [Candidatus Acidoferrales bacterium]